MAKAKEPKGWTVNDKCQQVLIEDEETYLEKLAEKAVKVVEVFADCWGPCQVVHPVLKRCIDEMEIEPERCGFLVCNADKIPVLAEYAGKSQPTFMVYRNGKLVHPPIKGFQSPLIEKLVKDNTPNTPDADDLDENPMYLQLKEAEEKAKAEAAAAAAAAPA
eukprot:CAMPEP_0183789054 /NCGR_PEP_ID=MMETSP0803_2-20130417/180_1 /TAXON_ID=195967 /ORGANISM="Crustomastix stigmata, Strain CCMP3273" /LENGTH=161 /DNA_ID=CAMNT_0026033213 /DNA_START=46 /DNA_END=531 /DNA_ORIENTATION=+